MVFNEVHSHEFDSILAIRTTAIHASSSGGLDPISARVPPKKNIFAQPSAERAVLKTIALTQMMNKFVKTPGSILRVNMSCGCRCLQRSRTGPSSTS